MNKLKFEFNQKKAIESIVYVLRQRPSLNLYNLLKILFEADKTHLKTWGRPVTGDHYIAMANGTVPSHIYDILRDLKKYDSKITYNAQTYIVSCEREPDLDLLSESDITALNAGVIKYADLSFSQVYDTNHQEKCWINSKLNDAISFEAIIDDDSLVEDLQDIQPFKIVL